MNSTPATGRKTTSRLKSARRIEMREAKREAFTMRFEVQGSNEEGRGKKSFVSASNLFPRTSNLEPRTSFLLRLVAVTHAVNGIDPIELRVDRFELLANALDVAVDRPLADVVVVRVALARQLPPCLDVTRMPHERLQHHEFGHGEVDRMSFPSHRESLRIELQRSDAEQRLVVEIG